MTEFDSYWYLGSSGSNFGIELYENVVKYARECCNPMAKSSEACGLLSSYLLHSIC